MTLLCTHFDWPRHKSTISFSFPRPALLFCDSYFLVWKAILKLIFLLDRVFSKVFCYRPSLNGFLGYGYIRDVEFRQKQ